MTRINLVDPTHLTDKHLLAEYRELPRIFTSVRKLIYQGKYPFDVEIPDQYCLGKGHCKFFYDKVNWLKTRYTALARELNRRGCGINEDLYWKILTTADKVIDEKWFSSWEPSPEEIYLNMARLCRRSKLESILEELESNN